MTCVWFIGESGAEWYCDESAPIGEKSGFGEVFSGSDAAGGPVAVKRVRLQGGDDAARRWREREVEIGKVIAGSTSLHLLRTLDVGRIGDDLFIVMPRAQGSLRSAMNSGLSESARIGALRDIVAGLIELAALSVLHRDLKPENVLSLDGRWQLADFGIARNLLEATATYTFRGLGTAPYKAPEIWNNQPATVQTDLYALGVVAYEVLTGARPFDGDEAALRDQHLHVAPKGPDALAPGLGRLVLRLLSKNPPDRPQDARAVNEALSAALKSLSPSQTSLQRAALEAQQRRVTAEAQHAVNASATESAKNRMRQALSELAEILTQGFDQIHEALPDAVLRPDGVQWHLIWNQARVTVVPWRGRPSPMPFEQDPLVAAGEVFLGPGLGAPAANVVCELEGGRLNWRLLRFRANAFVRSNYSFGPVDRPHGFDEALFCRERPIMRVGTTYVWWLERSELTPESVAELMNESIAVS